MQLHIKFNCDPVRNTYNEKFNSLPSISFQVIETVYKIKILETKILAENKNIDWHSGLMS